MTELKLNTNGTHKFSNGVVVVNTTPHPITFQNPEMELVSVPVCDLLINASANSVDVGDLFCKTEFSGTDEGKEIIRTIENWFAETYHGGETLVIIGSMIAAQAYPGKVFGMVAVPGYERVAPTEKRMRCDKFTTFA